jgi:hypothetical protein
MSEYQYFEFRAVDRPLSAADREALRALSSRAKVTATSFINSYNFGDFGGDPAKLMERWFDLHLYLANWGSRRLMIRLPKRLFDRARLETLLDKVECAELRVAGENLILDIARDELDLEDWQDDSRRLAGLAPLRGELLAGDLRLFYLLWLTEVEVDMFGPDEPEPMPGIGPLTASLEAFAAFFGLDPDLVEAAAERSPAAPRTVGELRARAEAIRLAHERAAVEEIKKARRPRLDALAQRGDSVWDEVEAEIAYRNTAGYDKAVGLLADLRLLAEERGMAADYARRLTAIKERHSRKPQFLVRLAKTDEQSER